jgi:hypothetical protein
MGEEDDAADRFVEAVRRQVYTAEGQQIYKRDAPLGDYLPEDVTVGLFYDAFGPPPDPLGDLLDAFENTVRNAQAAAADRRIGEKDKMRFMDKAAEAREAIRDYVRRKR